MYFFLDETLDINNTVEQNWSIAQKWLETAYNWAAAFLPKMIAALVIFIAGWWLTKFICKIAVRAMTRAKIDKTVITFLNSILNGVLKVLIILCVLSTVGFDMTTLIATVSAATVTIGMALKDSLANVASGTLIIINQKFKVGDYIETEGLKGTVVKIDMMYTTLCTYNNREVLIPNSRLTSNNIINYFVREKRRVDLIIPISYSEDIEKARKVIMELLDESELVLHEENNKVQVETLNESSVDLMVWIWCSSEDYWKVYYSMQENIKIRLEKNGITIPFNQLDLHIVENLTKESAK